MSRPVRHPKTGIYQFRKRVPEDLRQVIGKREEKVTLKTRDPAKAQVEYLRVASEVAERWENLRKGRVELTKKQAFGIAGECYRSIVARHEDNPDDRLAAWVISKLNVLIGNGRTRFIRFQDAEYYKNNGCDPEEISRKLATDVVRQYLDNFLKDRGLQLTESSTELVIQSIAKAAHQAYNHVFRMAEGDYRPDPDADKYPSWENPVVETRDAVSSTPSEAFDLVSIYDKLADEYGHAPDTRKKWRPIIVRVAEEHPDIRSIDEGWVVQWKNSLIQGGLKHVTVKDGYIAALKSVCTFAMDNKLIETNPAEGVRIRLPKRKNTRAKSFTENEALTILKATFVEPTENLSPEHRSARRWVPWICAYTGARVGEIAQLRKTDVLKDQGVWMFWITPEAGRVKTDHERYVAVHPHLIELGFLEFVKAQRPGPLFYDPARRRGGSDANPTSKKVGERLAKWVRQIGVDDRRVQPNHAWRHRFKTFARKVDMDPGTRDYIQGQVTHNEAEGYGEFPPDVLIREISKLPRFEFDEGFLGLQLTPVCAG